MNYNRLAPMTPLHLPDEVVALTLPRGTIVYGESVVVQKPHYYALDADTPVTIDPADLYGDNQRRARGPDGGHLFWVNGN